VNKGNRTAKHARIASSAHKKNKKRALGRYRKLALEQMEPREKEFIDRVVNKTEPMSLAMKEMGANKPNQAMHTMMDRHHVMRHVVTGLQLRKETSLNLLSLAKGWIGNFLNEKHLCDNCEKEFERKYDPTIILKAIDQLFRGLKSNNALSLFENALKDSLQEAQVDIEDVAARWVQGALSTGEDGSTDNQAQQETETH
jgi:hypothetical protein